MSLEPQPPVPGDSSADRRRHRVMTPLTRMRLHTQVLLRLARASDGPEWARVAADLDAIDADITLLVAQYDAEF